ncbi:BMP family ABC transporter substrate-binding protein [Spirochaeta isovalerica]|uniref:Simple sugar transport system substrate-binding protein n=1 Tax=Spirochaeta isovalerica TaxID=150 RepID=A0A841RGP3_9SPIO|nr:BMP family ABC transporter substrate-binding protein [Spirochaeta isovalerica]MBB6482190.1 simple sugar transport system substrate-binding protein [Spirochaeta isovalerica]
MICFKKISKYLIPAIMATFLLTGCSEKKEEKEDRSFSIAVFVPGVLAGSPTYEMMDKGVRAAALKKGATVKTVEGGFNQAEWAEKVTALAAEGTYDLIVSSNPSMPEISREAQKHYPDQDFLILEGSGRPDDQISTFFFNHRELAFLLGNFAGLVTDSRMDGSSVKKVGLIAGQEYPDMNNLIKPGFEMGFKNINSDIELDFRVIGNWYDASKASDLAADMYANGADIILTIAGGANQGVVSAAKTAGKFVLWYDSNGYAIEPGVVIGSGIIREDKAAIEMVNRAIDGSLTRGTAIKAGVKEGYIDFIDDDANYQKYVPLNIREEMDKIIKDMRAGNITLPAGSEG